VEVLQKDMAAKEEDKERALKDIAERYRRELKKERDAWIAGEKVRRERWESERIQEIRETTVKGIEPFLAGKIESHKKELADLQSTL
jgi:5-azacytidine-induced protein 1